MWEDDLVEEIFKELTDPMKVFPEHRTNLKKDIKDVIKKFSKERMIRVYLTAKKVNKQ